MKIKRYTFEFLSIFIAVISAFALNNWNDHRKDREAESKILSEINNGLSKDMEDARINMYGHRIGIYANRYFQRLINGQPVSTDSLATYYFNLCRDYVSIQNTSGYETLKSKGLEIIKRDSLRADIIALYEYDYNVLRKLEEEHYEMQFHQSSFKEINQFLAPHLQFDSLNKISGIVLPLELDESDQALLQSHFWRITSNRKFILEVYRGVEVKIEKLRGAITQELKRQS